ncbi:MAG: bifunctional transaldolase/phosoglucose isomerase [Nitrospirae bacterium]|nr:bifunctional transaldolase/phosoglucose isomerase [Nitrospirota bacterium]
MRMKEQSRFTAFLGPYEEPVQEALRTLHQQKFSERLWAKDASLWTSDPEAQKTIKNRLGWLTVPEAMAGRIREIAAFARSVMETGFSQVVLLGMGGSSLGPEVLLKTSGLKTGHPDLEILDSTDPATILRVEERLNLKRTLFILASKSGTTLEVESLYRYFSEKVRAMTGKSIGNHFAAITDPGTLLERLAGEQKFCKLFLNPPDIGGRYSALSYFGLVPAALIGIDLDLFLKRAAEMIEATAPSILEEDNPAVHLGVILGVLAQKGRDKVTWISSPPIQSFGVWVEQLLAESTGKEGKGLVPIEGERLGKATTYGDDRLFIDLSLDPSRNRTLDQKLETIRRAGHPVIRIRLRDPLDLAGEFFRWEAAVAVAGAVLKINPFDEPNVTESKENTRKVLEEFQKSGRIASQTMILEEDGIRLYGNRNAGPQKSLKEAIDVFLNQVRPHDYLALTAYLERSRSHETLLQKLRHWIRDGARVATTLGYGPRYLHSTGQLHKGGAGNGLFLQITADDKRDIPIPGKTYTFGILKQAQAFGDYEALTRRGFRVLRIHLGSLVEQDLNKLIRRVGLRLR